MTKKALPPEDLAEIAEIREQIKKQGRIRDRASAEIEGLRARMKPFQYECEHPNGYETSSMGDRGYYCPDCGYSR